VAADPGKDHLSVVDGLAVFAGSDWLEPARLARLKGIPRQDCRFVQGFGDFEPQLLQPQE